MNGILNGIGKGQNRQGWTGLILNGKLNGIGQGQNEQIHFPFVSLLPTTEQPIHNLLDITTLVRYIALSLKTRRQKPCKHVVNINISTNIPAVYIGPKNGFPLIQINTSSPL